MCVLIGSVEKNRLGTKQGNNDRSAKVNVVSWRESIIYMIFWT